MRSVRRRMTDAIAHLRLRFPHVAFEPRAAPMPPSAWRLASDAPAEHIGAWPATPLEAGIDRMVAAAIEKTKAT